LKKLLSLIALSVLFFAACKKETNSPIKNTFEAKIDGVTKQFEVSAAAFIIDGQDKFVSISGISVDSLITFTMVIKDTLAGNNMTLRSYSIRLSNVDDPNTTMDESVDSEDVSFNWLATTYAQNGTLQITSCDVNSKIVQEHLK